MMTTSTLGIYTQLSLLALSMLLACAHHSSVHADAGPPQDHRVATASVLTSTGPLPPAGKISVPDVVSNALPSVVSISTTRAERQVPSMFPFEDPFFRQFFGPELQAPHDFKEKGLGSGVVVEPNIILTNNHVISDATEINVTAPDRREFKAKTVGADPKTDLAVLRLEGADAKLKPIAWGDSSKLRLGDTVLAIGNPFGVGETVTMGIVSAQGRTDLGIEEYENFIQTDAAINPGNSGGALINTEGQLVGINTAILSHTGGYQGVGFAIPTNSAKPIMESLLKTGKVVRGYLGVGIQELTPELARAMKLPSISGVLITSVQPNTPAARAGLKHGDVILKVNSQSVDSTGKLRYLIASAPVGGALNLEIRRQDQVMAVNVKLAQAPNTPTTANNAGPSSNAAPGNVSGVTVSPLNDAVRDKYNISKEVTTGVVITAVEPGSKGAAAGLQPGDVVLELNRKPIHSVDQFKTEWNNAKDSLVLLLQRNDATLFIAINK